MKVKCLYKIGDTVNVLDSEKPMLITGYVLDDNGYVENYELVPKDSIMYCTETAITNLVEHGEDSEHGERNNVPKSEN